MRRGLPDAARGALAALAVLLVSGCGGSPPESLIQLRARATRICSVTNRQLRRIHTPPSEAQAEAFLGRGIAALGPELRLLRGLGPPSEAADVYEAAIDALTGELAALRQAAAAIDSEQDPVIAFKSLEQRLVVLETQAADAWQALGITACVSR